MAELKYTKDHEAIYVDGDVVWVGITQYAKEALGDLVFLELPDVGKNVSKGDEIAVVESVKTAAEVYTPVDGEVVEGNEELAADLEKMSEGGAWIVKVKMNNQSQLSELMDEAAYNEYLKEID